MFKTSRSQLTFPDAVQGTLFGERSRGTEAPEEIRGDDQAFLRTRDPDPMQGGTPVRVVDLFSGCGGISLGLREAARAYGLGFEVALAADFECDALGVFRQNLHPSNVMSEPLDSVFQPDVDADLSETETKLAQVAGPVDILVGGPPCQGHSDLNNTTRRSDPKNALYMLMARAAAILTPKAVLIENVVGASRDKSGVFQRTAFALRSLGYDVETLIMDGRRVGLPQGRRRLFLLATKGRTPELGQLLERIELPQRDVRWAIGDLVSAPPTSIFDQAAVSAKETKARIDFLFENDLFDLPDEQRPPCHRSKSHTYKSVYGRLSWDKPAQTITSGFYSMCMGRYVHPSLRRTLTAHEAARLQFFPDFYSFDSVSSRTSLATIIGNAVPPKLSYIAGLELLRDWRSRAQGVSVSSVDGKQRCA